MALVLMGLVGLWVSLKHPQAKGAHPKASLYLEGLRGVAALCVVFHHIIWAFQPAWLTTSYGPWYWAISGKFQVMLFFVLSGMVLSIQPLKSRHIGSCVKGFSKRYIRLMWPILATSMVAFALLASHNFYNLALAQFNHSWWLGLFYQFKPTWLPFLSDTLLKVPVLGFSQYNNVLWSMKAEFLGSLCIYVLLGFHLLFRIPLWVVIVVPLSLSFVAGMLGMELGLHLMCFLLGLSVVPVLKWCSFFSGAWWTGWLILLGLMLGSTPFYVESMNSVIDATLKQTVPSVLQATLDSRIFNTLALCLGAYLLMLGIAANRSVQRLFEFPVIIWLGRISFSLYLSHGLVLLSLGCGSVLQFQPVIGWIPAYMVAAMLTLMVSLLIAHILTLLVDDPSVTLSNWFGNYVVNQLNQGANRLRHVPDQQSQTAVNSVDVELAFPRSG